MLAKTRCCHKYQDLAAEHFLRSGSLHGTLEVADSKSRDLGAMCFLTCSATSDASEGTSQFLFYRVSYLLLAPCWPRHAVVTKVRTCQDLGLSRIHAGALGGC